MNHRRFEASAEAGEAGEAGNDAGPEAGYCASLGGTHALCEDFDETTAFSAQFTSVNVSTNGSLAKTTRQS